MKPSKNRVVLGINAYSHDAAAVLFVDGAMVFAAEEERYDRVRHSAAFPRGAIQAALRHAGLEAGEVQQVAFCWRRDMARWNKALYVLARFPRSLPFLWERPEHMPHRVAYLSSIRGLGRDLAALGVTAPITYVPHHLAHAVQAHRFGPHDEAAVLTADGMGELTATATWSVSRDGEPRRLAQRCSPHSIGKVYAAVTQHLGFVPDADEGKTMGLAPYGRPTYLKAFGEMLHADPFGLYRVALKSFGYPMGHTTMAGPAFAAHFGPAREPEGKIEAAHEDLAFALQAVTEEVLLKIARDLKERSGHEHLGLGGGLFLNCVLNGRLAREAGFAETWNFPAAGDAGAAAGGAAYVAGAKRIELPHAYWGDAFDDSEIERALSGRGHRVADPAEAAAEALADGKMIAWFQGRMEFGPRALGARSILADPRDPAIKDKLNETVKFREGFRPFAPAVLQEAANDWFADGRPSPFMLLTSKVRPHAREQIPGVTHVDGTARVQTVARDNGQPEYRSLLEAFARRTGVPILLNTSLNVRGEPIARTPEEALAVFDRTALDVAVLGRYIVTK